MKSGRSIPQRASHTLVAVAVLAAVTASVAFAETIVVPHRTTQAHAVATGDTLWDIANTYLTDPFLWPKIWTYNDQVINPDLIYPGGTLRIPVTLLKEEFRETLPVVVLNEPEPNHNQHYSPSGLIFAPPLEVVEIIAPTGLLNPLRVEAAGYITRDMGKVGVVLGIHDEHFLLGTGDEVYMKMKRGMEVSVGDQVRVIRKVRMVRHPETGKKIGNIVRVLGVLDVLGVDGRLIQTRLTRAYDYITAGDMVTRHVPEDLLMSKDVPTAGGVIVAMKDERTVMGSEDVVYLDRGTADGLLPGMKLSVMREGSRLDPDGVWGKYQLPAWKLASMTVLSVRGDNATAMIENATEAVHIGDRYIPAMPVMDPLAEAAGIAGDMSVAGDMSTIIDASIDPSASPATATTTPMSAATSAVASSTAMDTDTGWSAYRDGDTMASRY